MYLVLVALTILNIAVTTALPYLIYAVIGLLVFCILIVIPAFTGKSIAQMINRHRSKPFTQPEQYESKNG
jgi:FtsH-binding integral membrane protein